MREKGEGRGEDRWEKENAKRTMKKRAGEDRWLEWNLKKKKDVGQ